MKHALSGLALVGACTWLGIACATSATGRKQLILMPEDEMSKMGKQAFQSIEKEEPIETEPRANRYVSCVAKALLAANGAKAEQWEVVVFESKEANAFALPGRKIGVYTGMLEIANTQDQLAAVIGHEIAHVTQRHGNERVSQGGKAIQTGSRRASRSGSDVTDRIREGVLGGR